MAIRIEVNTRRALLLHPLCKLKRDFVAYETKCAQRQREPRVTYTCKVRRRTEPARQAGRIRLNVAWGQLKDSWGGACHFSCVFRPKALKKKHVRCDRLWGKGKRICWTDEERETRTFGTEFGLMVKRETGWSGNERPKRLYCIVCRT